LKKECIFQRGICRTVNKKQKQSVQRIFEQYHSPEFLRLDPLECVQGLAGRESREIGGLFCSALAYGQVEQIRKSISRVLEITGLNLGDFCREVPFKEKKKAFGGFRHRFNSGADVALLLECASLAIGQHGSIEGMFLVGFERADKTVKRALDTFARKMLDLSKKICPVQDKGFSFFFPAPSHGSTCKRLNMYLRWMVRHGDGIDLGIWKNVSPASLIIPVDTHVAAVAASLGLTRRKTVDWAMAEEITESLRRIDPDDPVRFDFSLCRAGMVGFRTLRKAA
jgi:uncharacterized protein (TIGR02757 family)